jgi:hypothetical protein
MEEILASIRRIIADDQALFAGGDGAPPEAMDREQDVPPQMAAYAGPANGRAREFGRDPAPARPAAAASAAQAEPRLVSPATSESVAAAFNALVASRFIQNSDVVASLARELLRPMLTAWLDENLPAIVERLVRAEIERAARGE